MIGRAQTANGRSPSAPISEPRTGRDYISWSQLSTFRQCPLKFQFRYLDEREPEFTASALVLGSSIHHAIETHHRHQLEGRERLSADDLLTAFWEQWHDQTEDSPDVRFGKHESIESIHELANRMLAAFCESELADVPGVVIGIEESVRSRLLDDRPDFLGIVDLAFTSENRLVIRDYKTSRSKWSRTSAESNGDQLRLYGELAKDWLPTHDIHFEFVVITKAKTTVIERFEVQPDARRVSRTKHLAAATLEAMDAGVFYPNPSAFNCTTCPYRSACNAWPKT